MALHLRRSADQFPRAGWKPDNEHLVVMSGEIVVGSLMKNQGGPASGSWTWSITCIIGDPNEALRYGVEETREQAQEALARAWRRWLERAGLKEA
jgi:hypothetical protein